TIWPRLVSVKVQVTVSLAARVMEAVAVPGPATGGAVVVKVLVPRLERQSTRLNSSHAAMASAAEWAQGLRVWPFGAAASVRLKPAFSLHVVLNHKLLHSFPTRRSSDLTIWPRLVSVKVQVTVSLAARVMEAVAVPGPATGGAVVLKVLVPRLETQLSPVRSQPAGKASLTEDATALRGPPRGAAAAGRLKPA